MYDLGRRIKQISTVLSGDGCTILAILSGEGGTILAILSGE